jgi:hypothetical protein
MASKSLSFSVSGERMVVRIEGRRIEFTAIVTGRAFPRAFSVFIIGSSALRLPSSE